MTDLPALLVNSGIFIVSGVSAVAAVVSVQASRRARVDVVKSELARDEAVAAQKEAAVALDKANVIAQGALDAQRLAMPAPWGQPKQRADGEWVIENTSGRTVTVSAVDGNGGQIRVFIAPADLPLRVQYGDVVPFSIISGGPTQPGGGLLTMTWSYDGETEVHEVNRRL